MNGIIELPLPADVELQTEQIVQSVVAEMVYTGIEVDGGLDDLLFWAGFLPDNCCTLLCVFAQRRDGGVGNGIVRQSAVCVARNSLDSPARLVGGGVIDIARLQMLERLATGPEEFELRAGLQLARGSVSIPGHDHLTMTVGQIVTIESVRFARVSFHGGYLVPRAHVASPYFNLLR